MAGDTTVVEGQEQTVTSVGTGPKSLQQVSAVNRWSTYMFEAYAYRRVPTLGTVAVKKLEEMAREKMKDRMDAYLYVFASAGTCATADFNRAAFDKWRIVPRMLRDCTARNVETTIFGTKIPAPLLLAPIGVQGIVHPDGELASARAAAKVGVPLIMSTASTRSPEAVALANGANAQRWYQLYWPKTPEVTLSILQRVKASGFNVLVVTLDTITIGWRPHDLDTAYLPFFHGTGIAVGTSDPAFMARHGLEPWAADKHVEFPYDPKALEEKAAKGDEEVLLRKKLGRAWLGEVNSGLYRTWEDLRFLKEHWDGPIVLKGIQSVQDAETAVDWVDGIVVSNHGGRQVDGGIASLDCLDKICLSEKVRKAQASGKFTVLFDSGIRTGSDIIKALALGAQAVLLGRPFMYGLTLGGEAGVEEQIRVILADFEVSLGLSGYKNVSEIWGNRDALVKEI